MVGSQLGIWDQDDPIHIFSNRELKPASPPAFLQPFDHLFLSSLPSLTTIEPTTGPHANSRPLDHELGESCGSQGGMKRAPIRRQKGTRQPSRIVLRFAAKQPVCVFLSLSLSPTRSRRAHRNHRW